MKRSALVDPKIVREIAEKHPARGGLLQARRLSLDVIPKFERAGLDENKRHRPSASYFACFWLFAVLMLAVMFVVLVMKRSVAEKGARIGGE